MPTELVVFDWDGTLVDSIGRIARCLALAAGETGLPVLEMTHYRAVIGLGLPEALAALYPSADESARVALRAAYVRHYVAAEHDPSPLYPGALDMLVALQAQGIRVAVATGKSRVGLARALAGSGLGGLFAETRTADETRSKPHPQMLQEILAAQRVVPARALMVGDTGFDLEMARHAQVPAVGVTHGAHAREELLRHAPLALIDHLSLLPGLVAAPRPPVAASPQPTTGLQA